MDPEAKFLGRSNWYETYAESTLHFTMTENLLELAIFSAYFGVEIDSIDVQTGRIDKFGEGSFDERVLIVYSGIHYDALALTPSMDSPPDFDQTRFSVGEDFILDAAKQLVDGLRKVGASVQSGVNILTLTYHLVFMTKKSHKFTDIANFTLKCEQCSTGLKGEKGEADLERWMHIHD
ncbi:hypothetical protein MBANPS3_000908 [Mucor bainieri]